MIFQNTVKWAEQEISSGRNDTVHDLLAYLAEQMIELNRKKNTEIKGFLKWLMRETGCTIDNLTGKTLLKNYHQTDFETLLAVLKRNRQKLSIDPANRKFQERAEKHFEESMAVLAPLKGKINATDKLIDRIVYKLYGLTEKEVAIVEGQ